LPTKLILFHHHLNSKPPPVTRRNNAQDEIAPHRERRFQQRPPRGEGLAHDIVGAREKDINRLALRIGKMNGQKSVMVMRAQGRAKTTRL
jgi:hypothetical protein